MGRKNGLLISIADSVAALYMVCNLCVGPRLFKQKSSAQGIGDSRDRFRVRSVASILV